MNIFEVFTKFPEEGKRIGMILAGYSDIEVALMYCVKVARNELNSTLKAMFRPRGETTRVEVADALGRQVYAELGLEEKFAQAIGAIKHCIKIRNQYAHSTWWDSYAGLLAFADLEELAKKNEFIADLGLVTAKFVDVPLLEDQLRFFSYTESLLAWLNFEGRARNGESTNPGKPPKQLNPPLLAIGPGHPKYVSL